MAGSNTISTGSVGFDALSKSLKTFQENLNKLQGALKDICNTYAVQETAERKLETVMRQRMGASTEEIQSIQHRASYLRLDPSYYHHSPEKVCPILKSLSRFYRP